MCDFRPIGGYFELELARGSELHKNAIALNSARSALEFLLVRRNYKKIYIPLFTCNAIEDTLRKLGVEFEKYLVDTNLEPLLDLSCLGDDEALLYTNYFGLKSNFISNLSEHHINLIVDNAQAFYDHPFHGVDTFYSPRKFFGVPDGGYLYTNFINVSDIPVGYSNERVMHLIKRHDVSAQSAYLIYKRNEAKLARQPLTQMSSLTRRILQSINYEEVKKQRKENFKKLHKAFNGINNFLIEGESNSVPLTYPLLCSDGAIKLNLLKNMVFTATYWTNVIKEAPKTSVEYFYATQLVHLPIDQRYTAIDMERIIELVLR